MACPRGNFKGPASGFLSSSAHLRSKRLRVLRAGIASRSENNRVRKTSRSKLLEEGAALLGASNSGEPVGLAGLNLWREGFCQD